MINQTSTLGGQKARQYKYYDMVMAGFVTILLCSNFIGPGKVCHIMGFSFGAGNLFFPISYIFGDILTEVYGYARTRKVIWTGFIAMIFASLMSYTIINMPMDPNEPFNKMLQPAIEIVFGASYRIVIGSILAFWAGDFANSFILAKLKVLTQGRHLWMRTISSTFVGQIIDSAIFYPLAFWGIWSATTMAKIIAFNIVFKVSIEVLMTPVTYKIVNFLKKAENEDFYDDKTDFTPFSIKV